MISVSVFRSLFISVALAATLANASIFTSPQKGAQVHPGTYFNVTWSSVIIEAMNAISEGLNEPALNASTTNSGSTPRSTATSATFMGRHIWPRQDSSDSSSVGTPSGTLNSTSQDATPSTATSASNTAIASSAATAVVVSATSTENGCMSDAAVGCINGMSANMTSDSPILPVCSELRLLRHDVDADPLFFATNLNVSAGWLQVYVPHGPPGDEYVFTLAVTDGDCAKQTYQSAPFTVLPAL